MRSPTVMRFARIPLDNRRVSVAGGDYLDDHQSAAFARPRPGDTRLVEIRTATAVALE